MMNVGTPLLFLVSTLIWGSTWLAITFQLGAVAPEISVAYRFALASLLLVGWCAATRRSLRFSLRNHGFLAALGVTFFGLNYIAVYRAEEYLSSGLVAVLFSTMVFMSPVGMRLAYRAPLTIRALVAAIFGVGGVCLLFLPELRLAQYGGTAARGIAYALAGTLIAVGGNLIAVRNHRAGIPTFPGTAWGMGYGALTAAIAATFAGTPWTFDTGAPYLFSLAYLAVFGSVIAFGAYLTLLKRVGAGPSAFITVSTPVIAMLLSTLFEGYRWTWTSALGVVLAVFGTWLALRPPKKGAGTSTTPA
jgi:drug/metabolite transporter (DMT)-like permease